MSGINFPVAAQQIKEKRMLIEAIEIPAKDVLFNLKKRNPSPQPSSPKSAKKVEPVLDLTTTE